MRRGLSLARTLTASLDRLAERLARYEPRPADSAGAARAAVALIVAPDPDSILLIRRAVRAGDPWSGQIGLPGGRQAPGDPDLLATAIRETAEEVGLGLDPAGRIGTLDDLAPRTPTLPPLVVRPFVFALDAQLPARLNHEVESAYWVPLDDLRDPRIHCEATVVIRGEHRLVPAYRYQDLVIWGMTERILGCFLQSIAS